MRQGGEESTQISCATYKDGKAYLGSLKNDFVAVLDYKG